LKQTCTFITTKWVSPEGTYEQKH